jgi:hypothetical protein
MRKEVAVWWTKLGMWLITTVVIVWDVFLAADKIPGNTISEVAGLGWAWTYSTLPLAYGVLTGHLFWHVREKPSYRLFKLFALIAIGGASIFLDFLDLYDVIPIVPVLIGVPLGRLGWPQYFSLGHPLFVWKR